MTFSAAFGSTVTRTTVNHLRPMEGNPDIITYRGKPAAAITSLKEGDIEYFVLENSPVVQKMIAEARDDIQAGKLVPLKEYLRKTEQVKI